MAGNRGLAEDIRTGLEPVTVQVVKIERGPIDPLSEKWHGKEIRRHVREFGVVMCLAAAIVSAILLRKGIYLPIALGVMIAGTLLLALSLYRPAMVRPIWAGWMKVAEGMGMVMTGIILTVTWSLVVIPIAMLLKVMKTKLLDLSFGAPVDSYWDVRDPKHDDAQLLKKQY